MPKTHGLQDNSSLKAPSVYHPGVLKVLRRQTTGCKAKQFIFFHSGNPISFSKEHVLGTCRQDEVIL
jgi:hypothetical protein